jgi:hypothetical protein
LNSFFKFGTLQQIALLDGNFVAKEFESLWGANKCGHGMTMLNRLPNDFQSRAAGGTQYYQFHRAFLTE